MVVKRSLLVSFASIAVLGIYSFWIEPSRLEITHHEIIGNVKRDLKVAHLSDLHLQHFGNLEKRVLSVLKSEVPDVVIITGDTLDGPSSLVPAAKFFSDLKVPLGIWAVLGNWENWSGNNAASVFQSLGIRLLVNEKAILAEGITLYGYDDSISGSPPRFIASRAGNEDFCVSLFHSPQFFDEISNLCPLSLAGHTHGGQVRFPILGPVWLPRGSGEYLSGWYEKSGSRMYVSRGVGTSVLPVRFLAPPEVTFISVKRKK